MSYDSEYETLLKKFLMKYGALVHTDGGSAFGWLGDDYLEGMSHIRQCGYDVSSLDEDASWLVFNSTFDDHDTYSHGMEMRVTCTCDKYVDRWVRWEGRTGEGIRLVLNLIK